MKHHIEDGIDLATDASDLFNQVSGTAGKFMLRIYAGIAAVAFVLIVAVLLAVKAIF